MKTFPTRLQTRFSATSVAVAVFTLALAGCAVTPGDVKLKAEEKSAVIGEAQKQAAQQQVQEPPLTRIKGNFLGSIPQAMANGASLPATFRDVTLGFGNKTGTLEQVARNLRTATGLSVRINADVYAMPGNANNPNAMGAGAAMLGMPGMSGMAGMPTAYGQGAGAGGMGSGMGMGANPQGAGAAFNSNLNPNPVPSANGFAGMALPGTATGMNAGGMAGTQAPARNGMGAGFGGTPAMTGVPGVAGAPGMFGMGTASGAPNPAQVQLPLSFAGDLADYLNSIASTLGVNWEYTRGELHFHRNITRIFTVMIPTGTVTYSDSMSASGSGSAGSAGGGGGSSGGASSGASSSVSASYNPWDAVLDTLKSLVSSTGKYSASKASGTITVTDNRDVLDHVAKWIAHENAALMTQVSVDVREITVALNDGSQVGLDLNLVYQKLSAAAGGPASWGFKFNSPSTLTDGAAGSAGFNLTKPDSRWVGSTIATQALNTFGQVVSDNTETIVTKNRVPGRKQTVTEQAYLASTTPATGGGVSGGTGVPGLTPGMISYGTNLTVIPIIGENNTVSLELFDAQSSLVNISSVSTGSGATLQQINTPTLARQKISGTYVIGQGETLIIVGSNGSNWSSNAAYGVTGASQTGKRGKTMQVLMVTPRILQGS